MAQFAGQMDTEPSEVNSVQASEQSEEDGNDVIVIHEHHHHHHHEDEDQDNGTTSSGALLENILNDQVLYDFVSFLIEEAQSNENWEEHRAQEESDIWRRHSEPYRDVREQEQQLGMVSSHDTSQFLNDGFRPIIEVELD